MIAAEERGEEAEARGHGEHDPHQRAEEGAAEIERPVRIRLHDADASHHLAERLSAGGERDEVAAVLHEQERQQRRLRQDAEIVEVRPQICIVK